MKVTTLHSDEYLEFYQGYINNIPKEQSLGILFQENKKELLQVLNEEISAEKLKFRYAEGKWSIAEVLQHLIDVERIFQYRALCIARGDQTSLPGFDHDEYAKNSFASARSLNDFKKEFETVRNSTIKLYRSFPEAVLEQRGTMNGAPASVRAIGFIVVGHAMHHKKILMEKYL
ncbi:DinB family protein [Zunongwangia sp. F363]|uniref:DinB family protein n=1 Tax=Autumnicola tepida TaxID=3075595 RepID=A0ABU3CCN5_9FLAO|nr:DinB family protein [Zunongwangia sp. F363]MDT0644090.1 DinB family protein [Zunongwangia sp. F363]